MTDKPTTKTIRALCESYGISQTELSRKYDIPIRTVQDWYAGRRTPPSYVVNMLDDLLYLERETKRKGL
jgi:DNA-binding transcriptional regulator YiaG